MGISCVPGAGNHARASSGSGGATFAGGLRRGSGGGPEGIRRGSGGGPEGTDTDTAGAAIVVRWTRMTSPATCIGSQP
eukprot:1191084-Prorocentrum_minimum.AAC.2